MGLVKIHHIYLILFLMWQIFNEIQGKVLSVVQAALQQ